VNRVAAARFAAGGAAAVFVVEVGIIIIEE